MLDQFVWESVNDVIQDPERLVEEWTRRGADDGELGHAREHCDEAQRFLRVQKHTLQRLQDAFEAGALTIEELTERSGRVRARIARAEEDLADARASLTKSLEIHALAGKLSTFAEQVRSGLERLDWHARRQLIRTLVSRVEIDEEGATIVYRIPSSPRRPGEPAAVGGPGPKAEPKTSDVQLRSGGEHAVVAGEVEVGVRDQGGES
jgi:site-specific DNA recombinase